jgi:hypothetical protein
VKDWKTWKAVRSMMKDDDYQRRNDLMNQPITTNAVDPEDEHRARLTIVMRASDTEEARMFLSMLGLVPGEEKV